MTTTTISAATGCLATTALGFYLDGVVDAKLANNGILAGLVAITASCSVVNLWGAWVIGLVAAPVYVAASRTLVQLGIDDVVDAFPVHGACGAWGVVAAGLFGTKYFYARASFLPRGESFDASRRRRRGASAETSLASPVSRVVARLRGMSARRSRRCRDPSSDIPRREEPWALATIRRRRKSRRRDETGVAP